MLKLRPLPLQSTIPAQPESRSDVTDQRDTIYAQQPAEGGLFAFDERVVKVFPDMIQRSVPGYTTIVAMTGLLARKFARPVSAAVTCGSSVSTSPR